MRFSLTLDFQTMIENGVGSSLRHARIPTNAYLFGIEKVKTPSVESSDCPVVIRMFIEHRNEVIADVLMNEVSDPDNCTLHQEIVDTGVEVFYRCHLKYPNLSNPSSDESSISSNYCTLSHKYEEEGAAEREQPSYRFPVSSAELQPLRGNRIFLYTSQTYDENNAVEERRKREQRASLEAGRFYAESLMQTPNTAHTARSPDTQKTAGETADFKTPMPQHGSVQETDSDDGVRSIHDFYRDEAEECQRATKQFLEGKRLKDEYKKDKILNPQRYAKSDSVIYGVRVGKEINLPSEVAEVQPKTLENIDLDGTEEKPPFVWTQPAIEKLTVINVSHNVLRTTI